MTNVKIAEILKVFEAIRKRPAMYVINFNVEAMDSLIYGLNTGCFIFEENQIYRKHKEIKDKVKVERGWHLKPVSVTYEMKERGLSDEEVIQELLTIEIEAWSRMKCKDELSR